VVANDEPATGRDCGGFAQVLFFVSARAGDAAGTVLCSDYAATTSVIAGIGAAPRDT
jgi:hypothetical protein